MIKCTRVFLLYRRRVGLEVLPCFEVPVLEVLEGTIGRVIGTEKQREGPRTLPFSGVRTLQKLEQVFTFWVSCLRVDDLLILSCCRDGLKEFDHFEL